MRPSPSGRRTGAQTTSVSQPPTTPTPRQAQTHRRPAPSGRRTGAQPVGQPPTTPTPRKESGAELDTTIRPPPSGRRKGAQSPHPPLEGKTAQRESPPCVQDPREGAQARRQSASGSHPPHPPPDRCRRTGVQECSMIGKAHRRAAMQPPTTPATRQAQTHRRPASSGRRTGAQTARRSQPPTTPTPRQVQTHRRPAPSGRRTGAQPSTPTPREESGAERDTTMRPPPSGRRTGAQSAHPPPEGKAAQRDPPPCVHHTREGAQAYSHHAHPPKGKRRRERHHHAPTTLGKAHRHVILRTE